MSAGGPAIVDANYAPAGAAQRLNGSMGPQAWGSV